MDLSGSFKFLFHTLCEYDQRYLEEALYIVLSLHSCFPYNLCKLR